MNKDIQSRIASAKTRYLGLCQNVGAAFAAPTPRQAQCILFVVGFGLLLGGMTELASAQSGGLTTRYNDDRIANALNAVLTYLEGTFGALVMAAAGIGAILSAAFGQYKAALSLMVVAIGAFILRSLMSTFFNDARVQD